MHKFLIFIFEIELYIFRTGFLSESFYSKIKFDKFVHLVGFITIILLFTIQ